MAKTLQKPFAAHRSADGSDRSVDWEKKMSDHVAYALLVYTGLQIFVVMGAVKSEGMSVLPYFGLVLLVGLIIPLCRNYERRWHVLANSELSQSALARRFRVDRLAIWLLAIGLPFAFVALFRLLVALFWHS